MAPSIVADVYFRFNPQTRQVDIIADGVILETTTIALAASRVTFHRGELNNANPVAVVASSPYKRQNRGVR